MSNRIKTKSSVFQVATSYYLALIMTVFLLYTGTMGFQRISWAKFTSFLAISGGYIIGMLLLLLIVLILLKTRWMRKYKLPSIKKCISESTWVQRLMVIYLLMTWISAIISPYFPTTVIGASRNEGALTITAYVLVFLLVSLCGRVEKWMLPVFAVSVSIFDIICILQLFGLNPFTLYPEGYDYFGANVHYNGAYLGTIGNVDLVAAFLCLAIPIFWVCLMRLNHSHRWLLLIPLGLSLFVLVKMWVLSGLVGVFVGCVIALCATLPVSDKTRKVLWIVLISGAIAAIALIFFVDVGSGLFHEVHLLLHGHVDDTFGSGRIHIWRSVLERIPENPWFGTGPDTMQFAGVEAFQRYDEQSGVLYVGEIDVAHNDYLNILFHQGVFAFVAYVAALVLSARNWLRCAPHSVEAAALGSAVLCYCIQVFFGLSVCVVAPYFWIMLAFLEITYKNGNK